MCLCNVVLELAAATALGGGSVTRGPIVSTRWCRFSRATPFSVRFPTQWRTVTH